MPKAAKSHRLPKILVIIAIVISALIITLQFYQAEWKPQAKTELRFAPAALPFAHKFDADAMLPFLGSAVFDTDGDGIDEVFLGGGIGQADQILTFASNGFISLHKIEKPENSATHGAAHLDLDEDGDVDLIVARSDGIWLYDNMSGEFKPRKLNLPLADNTPRSPSPSAILIKTAWSISISPVISKSKMSKAKLFSPGLMAAIPISF